MKKSKSNKNKKTTNRNIKKKNKKPIYIFLHLPKNGGASLNRNIRKKLSEEEAPREEDFSKLTKLQKDKIKYLHGHNLYYGIHKYFPNRESRYIIFIRDPAERRVSQYNHDISRIKEKNPSQKVPSFQKWYKMQIKNEQVFLCNKKFKGIPGRKAPAFTNNIITNFDIGHNKYLKIIGYKILKLLDLFRKSKKHKKQELQNVKKLLDKCWFVTTTDNLDKDLPKIFKAMNLSTDWEHYRKAKYNGEKTDKDKREVTKTFNLDEKTKERIYEDNPLDLNLYEYARKI